MTAQTKTPPTPPAQVPPEADGKGTKETPPEQTTGKPPAPPPVVPPKPEPAKEPAAPPKVEEKKPEEKAPDTQPPAAVDYGPLKLPDGSALKPTEVEAVKAWAKEQGLNLKQAQAQLDRESGAAAARVEAEKAELAQKRIGWQEDVAKDKLLGNENLPRTTQRCAKALERFDKSGVLKKVLEESGLGNFRPVVETLEAIGASMEDDKLIKPPPVPVGDAKKSDADVFYPEEKKG